MGKGDRKTRRGKIYRSSHGNVRPHKPGAGPAGPAAARHKTPVKHTARRTGVRRKTS